MLNVPIDNALVAIERVQRRQRLCAEIVFSVVVVFDHVRVVLDRPLEKLCPARPAHDAAERELMRRRDVGERSCGGVLDAQALIVDVDGHDLEAEQLE